MNSKKSHTCITRGEEPALISVERSVLVSGLLSNLLDMV